MDSVTLHYLGVFIIIILFTFILYRLLMLAIKKKKEYLKHLDYIAITGIFITNMLSINHIRSYLGDMKKSALLDEIKYLDSVTILNGLKLNYERLYFEFISSIVFFILLLIIVKLKNKKD